LEPIRQSTWFHPNSLLAAVIDIAKESIRAGITVNQHNQAYIGNITYIHTLGHLEKLYIMG
jgi:hypothetical protein